MARMACFLRSLVSSASSLRRRQASGFGAERMILPCLLLLLTFSACAHAPQYTPKGFEESRSTRAQLEASMEPRRWAVVVGINKFDDPSFTPLKWAEDDAKDIAWALRHPNFGHFDRVITLTGSERTTRKAILDELLSLRNDLRRQDTLVIYFSGHGTMEFDKDGNPLLYLVAQDTRVADLFSTGLELNALRRYLTDLKPQRKVLILDNCFAGTGKSRISMSTRRRLEASPTVWQSLEGSMGQSEAVLMASTMGGVAQETDELRHATYSFYLLKALTDELTLADANQDGAVTAYEAHDYARLHTMEKTKREQIPEGYFRVIGRAEMFLSGKPNPERSQDAALVYAYGASRQTNATLEINGRAKGSFPGTVALEPGSHRLTIRDDAGRVLADNRLRIDKGQAWSLGLLLDELQGYRRFFSLNSGGFMQPMGESQVLWGTGAPRLGLTSGYRVRGGLLRGLSLSFDLGWSPTTPELLDVSTESHRTLFDAGLAVVLRRPLGRLQLGGGWAGSMLYVSPVKLADAARFTATTASIAEPWLMLPGGPVLWQGFSVNRQLTITLEERLGVFASSAELSNSAHAQELAWGNSFEAQPINLIPQVRLGVEFGF